MTNSQATIAIPLPFPPENKSYSTVEKFYVFWDLPSTAKWFEQHGYTLYTRKESKSEGEFKEASAYPTLESPVSGKMDYPYAHYDLRMNSTGKLHGKSYNGRIAFAQETRNPSHHVVIKIVATDSEEHRILTFLQKQGLKVLEENCLVPVLDVLSNGPYAFVIMSRWGDCPYYPEGGPIQNCFRTMHSLLKALAFLHRHNILHRDIKLGNVLVNHFSDDSSIMYKNCISRRELQWADELQYSLCDFDISIMLPPATNRAQYRLPYQLSWEGSEHEMHDTTQGEFDYDPFAFDVGTLGIVFCSKYQHLCRDIPMLAPFLDKMTTRNIPQRFTATEALDFFEDFLPKIDTTTLNQHYSSHLSSSRTNYDRWKHLSPDFTSKWEHFREPRISLRTTFMRWLCSCEGIAMVVRSVRLYSYRLASLYLHIFA